MDLDFLNDEKQNYSLFAQNVIRAKGENVFSTDRALSCLAKDDSFFRELMSVFNSFFHVGITPNIFENVLDKIQTSNIDLQRLKLCSKLFSEYILTMEENGYCIPFPTKMNMKMKTLWENGYNFWMEKCVLQNCYGVNMHVELVK